MSEDMRKKMLLLIKTQQSVRILRDKYEQDLIMFVVNDAESYNETIEIDKELKKQMTLMRTVEQKLIKKFISDLDNILKI